LLTILTAAGLLGVYLISWFVALLSPLALEYEGPALWAAMELARGQNIYDAQRLIEAPWAVTIYTPLFFVLGAPFQFGGFNYPGLRLISMVSDVVGMFFFYRLLSLYSTNRLNIAIGMVLFASYVTVWSGSLKARVDMLALSLSIAALYFAARGVKKSVQSGTFWQNCRSGFKQFFPSVILSVAAIYAKLASIVLLPAVCVYLLARKRYADLLVYSVSSVVLSAVLLLYINSLTGGGFLQHITFAFNVPFSSLELSKHLELLGVDWPKLVMVPIIGLVWWFRAEDKERLVLPLALALISGALTVYTVGTMHANLNHGMLFYFTLSWLTVIFLEAYPLSLGASLVLVSALCTYILGTQVPNMFALSNRMGRSVEDLKKMHISGQTMFVEDPTHAIVCGGKPLFVDVVTFLQVWDRDKRSLADLEQGLVEKRYPAVVINLNDSLNDKPALFWSDSILEKLDENYKKVEYVAGNGDLQQLYVPK
jgi:hypothetical protein